MQSLSTLKARSAIGFVFLSGAIVGVAGTAAAATLLGSDVFSDVAKGSYYDTAIGELYDDGIIKGYEGTNRFGPDDTVTRGQVAVMLKRLRDDMEGRGPSDDDDDEASSSSRSRSTSSSSASTASSTSSSSSYNPKGAIRFTTTAFSVNETVANATITVVRTGGNEGSTSINYAVTAGTATAGSDFTVANGTLNFANKETSKSFTVPILDDTSGEGNETITLTLTSPGNGAGLGNPATATLTITDNEQSASSSSSVSSASSSTNPNGTLSFSALTYAVMENGGNITVTVKRDGGTTGSVNVNYATSNGTASSNTDYAPATGTLTFAAGENSKSFTVSITDDASIDGSKSINLTLSSPTSGASLGKSTASISIFDDESMSFGSGALKFSKTAYDVTENDGKAEVIVLRGGGADGTVSVGYSTTSGTASSGDYTPVSGTLVFAPGEASKIITIPILKDSTSDAGETFFVDLVSPTSPATLTSPSTTTVTIY